MASDLADTALDGLAVACTVNNDGVFLVDLDLTCTAELINGGILQLKAKLAGDDLAAGERCDIGEHFFSSVAEARSLNAHAGERAAELVEDQGGQRLALNVLRDDDELLAGLYDLLEQRQNLLNVGDLLIGDEDVRVVDDSDHLVGIGDHVRRNVAAVEHHAFYDLAVRLSRLGFFNGDNAVGRDLFHRVGDEVADLLTCRGNSCNTGNVLRAGDLLGVLLNRLNSGLGRLLNALSQNHRVCACGNVLHALTDECLCKQCCGRGAVACNVVRLGCNFLHELCAHVLKRIFKLNFLSDCHAVVRDERCAELLIEHNVSALRAKGDLNGICKLVDTAEQCFSGFFAVNDLLCHNKLPHNSKYQK